MAIIRFLSALLAISTTASCTSFGQIVYNCNPFVVKVYRDAGNSIGPFEFFGVRDGTHDFRKFLFIYVDGSRHSPKIVADDDAQPIYKSVGTPSPSNAVEAHAICKAFGPGVVIIQY